MLGLKGELKWWKDVGILGIFKEEFNIYAYYLRKTAREEKDGIL